MSTLVGSYPSRQIFKILVFLRTWHHTCRDGTAISYKLWIDDIAAEKSRVLPKIRSKIWKIVRMARTILA